MPQESLAIGVRQMLHSRANIRTNITEKVCSERSREEIAPALVPFPPGPKFCAWVPLLLLPPCPPP